MWGISYWGSGKLIYRLFRQNWRSRWYWFIKLHSASIHLNDTMVLKPGWQHTVAHQGILASLIHCKFVSCNIRCYKILQTEWSWSQRCLCCKCVGLSIPKMLIQKMLWNQWIRAEVGSLEPFWTSGVKCVHFSSELYTFSFHSSPPICYPRIMHKWVFCSKFQNGRCGLFR